MKIKFKSDYFCVYVNSVLNHKHKKLIRKFLIQRQYINLHERLVYKTNINKINLMDNHK